jgi:hypothetical protein
MSGAGQSGHPDADAVESGVDPKEKFAVPKEVEHWSLTTLREKLVKNRARVGHGRRCQCPEVGVDDHVMFPGMNLALVWEFADIDWVGQLKTDFHQLSHTTMQSVTELLMSKESKVADSAKYGAGRRWRERGTGHKSRVAATLLTIALLGAPLGQAQAAQDIVLDTVPPVTEETLSGGTVEGRYLGNPTAVQLCSAVFIDGLGYFVKPSTATPEIAIMADGSFRFDSTTGGCDNRWERLALTVIPDLDPCPTPSSSPDPGSFITIVAQRIFDRQPRGVDFDGESLWVKDSGSCTNVAPGSNDFLRDNVRVQLDGLRIETSDDGSKLTSAEVVNREPTGYGRYVHEITLPEGGLDEATVLGIFSFDRDGVGSFFNEVDFEIGESLIAGGNAQCIVQGGDVNIFTIDPADRELTVVLDWIPGAFACAIYLGHVADSLDTAVPLEEWTSTNNIPEPGADSRMRINLWIDDSAIAMPTSVTVKSVRWPLPPPIPIEPIPMPWLILLLDDDD